MLNASLQAIRTFAGKHSTETFYAFAIDADMLCLNSVQEFEKTLRQYQAKWPTYRNDAQERENLRMNPGDWAYQGFCTLNEDDGFCRSAYEDHYDQAAIDQAAAQSSEYAKAMDRLIQAIDRSGVLHQLQRTPDFRSFRAEHDY